MWYLAFVASSFLLAMIPGANTIVIMRQTLRSGRRSGVAALAGTETGVLFWGIAAAFGLSALVAASQLAYDVMRVVGAVVLVWMGVQALWNARHGNPYRAMDLGGDVGPRDRCGKSYGMGLATLLANPKAVVFGVSFLPQFVPDGANIPLTLVLLAVTWVLTDTVWYLMVIWLITRVKRLFARPGVRRRLDQISGIVLVGLGIRLVAEAR